MSKLGQLRTCLNLMTERQNSCLSPLKDLSISIAYLLQSLLEMLKFPSNSGDGLLIGSTCVKATTINVIDRCLAMDLVEHDDGLLIGSSCVRTTTIYVIDRCLAMDLVEHDDGLLTWSTCVKATTIYVIDRCLAMDLVEHGSG